MRRLLFASLFFLAGCSDPLAPYVEQWSMHVEASECWPAFSLNFEAGRHPAIDPDGVVGYWWHGDAESEKATVVGTLSSDHAELRFFPLEGGLGADFVDGTFTDPHGSVTDGGDCAAAGELSLH